MHSSYVQEDQHEEENPESPTRTEITYRISRTNIFPYEAITSFRRIAYTASHHCSTSFDQ